MKRGTVHLLHVCLISNYFTRSTVCLIKQYGTFTSNFFAFQVVTQGDTTDCFQRKYEYMYNYVVYPDNLADIPCLNFRQLHKKLLK